MGLAAIGLKLLVWCVGKGVMVKSSLIRRFGKNLQLRDWVAARLPRRSALETQPNWQHEHQSTVEAPTEMRIEGVGESSGLPPVDRNTPPAGRSSQLPRLPKLPEMSKPWRWSLVWLASLGVLGGMGAAALVWLVSLPPQVDCQDAAKLSLDMEKLYCAQVAAQSGDLPKLIAGIDQLQQWQTDHPLYREAQRLIGDWSEQVFTIAIRQVEKGDLKGAESAISHIPSSAPIHGDAQKALQRWRKYSKQASDIYATGQAALKKRDWSTVSRQIVQLAEFERDYWDVEQGADRLAQQMGVEKQAWQTLSQAQKMASAGNLKQLGLAIATAQQVTEKTYAAESAKGTIKTWSQKLVQAGAQQWQKGDRAGAVKTLALPATIKNTPEVSDLYHFGHAYQLAHPALAEKWVPSMAEIVNLTEAIAAVNQVKSTSPFYGQAQSLKQKWEAELADLIQLKYASTMAELGQRTGLELAIGQAKQIDAKRPRRLQAQSLIAYWSRETERLEDQPMVDRAMRLAQGGTIEALQSAIAQASQIDLGRALRGRAQTLIAGWRAQIQTIEDQPKLDQAWMLARQGKLMDAIDVASTIQSGRSLHREARSAIARWRAEQIAAAQIAQDQPTLDRANRLANSGNLSEAIRVADQIGAGRALYDEARTAINRWENQLNPPAPEPEETTDSYWENVTSPETWSPENFPTEVPVFSSPSLTNGGMAFPSPTLSPGADASPQPPLPELQLVPPSAPYPQPSSQPVPSVVPPPNPAPASSYVEPAPPVDPLPPPIDPLPPSP